MIDRFCDWLIPDWGIKKALEVVFSKPSILVHTIWFIVWFILGLDVGLLTNIVSLEAIYIGILIGVQQIRHHNQRSKK